MRFLAACLLVVVLTACDDDEAPAATTIPTSKGACPDSYFEEAFSSSDALSLLVAINHVAEVRSGPSPRAGSAGPRRRGAGGRLEPARALTCPTGSTWA